MEESVADFAGVLSVAYITSRSTDDGLNESVNGETFLFVITCECSSARLSVSLSPTSSAHVTT